MARQILFLQIPNFYVAAERRQEPSRQAEPLVVVQERKVIDVSPEAAEWGVTTASTLSQAQRLCPEVQVIEFVEERYLSFHQRVWDVLARHTPRVEPVALAQGFCDLTGLLGRGETPAERLSRLRREIHETVGVQPLIGGGSSKFVARLAASHNRYVPASSTQAFLDPVPVRDLVELEDKLRDRLTRLGIDTLGVLSRLPEQALIRQFGATGKWLQQLSRGEDSSPVLPLYPPRRELVTQRFTPAEEDERVLRRCLARLANRLWTRLQRHGEQPGAVELQVAWLPPPAGAAPAVPLGPGRLTAPSNPEAGSLSSSLPLSRPPASAARLSELFSCCFRQVWNGRPVWSLTGIALALHPKPAGQLNLWDNRASQCLCGQLETALRLLRKRYGARAVQTGRQYRQHHRPRWAERILALQQEQHPTQVEVVLPHGKAA